MNALPPTNPLDFQPFDKMARLTRECIITEKIDGTNAQILITPEPEWVRAGGEGLITSVQNGMAIVAGSRTRWIRPKNPGEKGDPDNYGFAAWVKANAEDLVNLGPGKHFGEWFGAGINRAYGLTNGDRRFALFNVSRWFPNPNGPGVFTQSEPTSTTDNPIYVSCCSVVPLIWRGNFDTRDTDNAIEMLRSRGSFAVPGFMKPEGIVVFHIAAGKLFKKTLEGDASPKSVPGLTNPRQLSAGADAAQGAFRRNVAEDMAGAL